MAPDPDVPRPSSLIEMKTSSLTTSSSLMTWTSRSSGQTGKYTLLLLTGEAIVRHAADVVVDYTYSEVHVH